MRLACHDVTMGTSIPCSEAVADELYQRKQRGESYDDVLRRALGLTDEVDA